MQKLCVNSPLLILHCSPKLIVSSYYFSVLFSTGFKCPVCSKFISSDEMDLHLVMCLTKPRVTYNGENVCVAACFKCYAYTVENMLESLLQRKKGIVFGCNSGSRGARNAVIISGSCFSCSGLAATSHCFIVHNLSGISGPIWLLTKEIGDLLQFCAFMSKHLIFQRLQFVSCTETCRDML